MNESESREFVILVFMVSSFLIVIVLLNMLIAIMSDAYEEATAKKEILKFEM